MPAKTPAAKAKTTPAPNVKESITDVEKGIQIVKEKILQERKAGKASVSDLERDIKVTQAQMEGIQDEIDSAKATCANRKSEVAGWEKWYESQPHDQKAAAFAKMNSENSWRMAEINTLQGKITSLEGAKLALFEAVEKAKVSLAAVNANVYDLPIEQDPRLKTLLDARVILKSSIPPKTPSTKK